MFLWKFPRGYAKIVFTAKRPEAFANELLKNGVSLHNVHRISCGEVEALIRFDRLGVLLEIASDLGVESRIIKTGGVTLPVRLLLARCALFIGLALASALIALLSRRILFISVDGASAELNSAVRSLIEDELAILYKPASSIQQELIRTEILELAPCLEFVRIEVDGVVLRIELFENLDSEKERQLDPSSIYSNCDCVIVKLCAFEGKALVRSGEAVKKDQLLVSGNLTAEGGEYVCVHSDAEIIGEVARVFEIRVDPTASVPIAGGNFESVAAVELFGLGLLSQSRFEDRVISLERRTALDAAFLPVFVSGGKANELVIGSKTLSRDEMLSEAQTRLNAVIASALPDDAMIVSKSSEFAISGGALILTAKVHTYEKIGYTRYL